MANKLPYFKFFVSEWVLGRISDHPDKVQGAFIVAICHYWNKNCDYNSDDFERKLGSKRFKMLLEFNFFEIIDGKVCIDFLNEQYEELSGIQQLRKKAGLARAEQAKQHELSYLDVDKKKKRKKGDKDIKGEIDLIDPPKKEKFNFKNSLIEYGFKEELVDDWLLVRAKKNATNTKTAFTSFIKEVESRTITDLNKILEICCEKSWSGFKYKWVDNLEQSNNGKTGNQNSSQTSLGGLADKAREVLRGFNAEND